MSKVIDISGQKFGKLVALEIAGKGASGNYHWKCICECGNTKIFSSGHLRSGKLKSCGCASKSNVLELEGQTFNKLTVIKQVESKKQNTMWQCVCECGNIVIVRGSSLVSGHTRSCNCGRSQRNLEESKKKIIPSKYWIKIQEGAKFRNINFDLTEEYALSLFNGKCALSNNDIIFTYFTKDKIYQTASLDRIDSSKGYIEENVQWVHKDINFMKNTLPQDRFIELCKAVATANP